MSLTKKKSRSRSPYSKTKKSRSFIMKYKSTIISNQLSSNTQKKILQFLTNISEQMKKTSYSDLQRFVRNNPQFVVLKLNGKTLKSLFSKTNERQFQKFKETLSSLKSIKMVGGSLSIVNNTKEDTGIIKNIKSVNEFLGNSEVKKLALNLGALILFLCFVIMAGKRLLNSDGPIEWPSLGENAIVTLGVAAIVGLTIVKVASIAGNKIVETKQIEERMQDSYLRVVENSRVAYGATGFAAMGQVSFGGPRNQMTLPYTPMSSNRRTYY